MTCSLLFASFHRVSLLCAVASACVGISSSSPSSVPATQQHQPRSDDAATAEGFGAALWSVLDGVSLTARDGKSVVNPLPADRVALQASAADPRHKNALLDGLLADRVEEFVSTRTAVLMNESAEQEGRSRKKKLEIFRKALALAGMLIFSAAGSVIVKSIALTAITALMASKFAIGLYAILTLGKILQDYQNNHSGKPAPEYFDRIMQIDDHNTAATAYHSVL
ncbi:Protein of unknown function DUF1676 [Cinara cedri]|uniref:Uncharacterized protein n=1 Tax=Cinara cedri TaxID=506608 RepID=A0A5E4MZU4_9HEMI|nr:Protein of unknown function DUF1676 [Cinara cedri]